MSLVGVLEEPWYNTHQEALERFLTPSTWRIRGLSK